MSVCARSEGCGCDLQKVLGVTRTDCTVFTGVNCRHFGVVLHHLNKRLEDPKLAPNLKVFLPSLEPCLSSSLSPLSLRAFILVVPPAQLRQLCLRQCRKIVLVEIISRTLKNLLKQKLRSFALLSFSLSHTHSLFAVSTFPLLFSLLALSFYFQLGNFHTIISGTLDLSANRF